MVGEPVRAASRTSWSARVVGIGVAGITLVGVTACSDTSATEPAADEYLGQLEAVCAHSTTQLEALPDPPDGITITEFATQASSILRGEAEQVRDLDPPDELDADHRALIANDEDQAAAWNELADTLASDNGDLTEITTLIASLNLGRNDLVATMGAPTCVRLPG
jgi:hypothetical protein